MVREAGGAFSCNLIFCSARKVQHLPEAPTKTFILLGLLSRPRVFMNLECLMSY